MQRAIVLLFILIGLLLWLGFRVKDRNKELATVFFTVSAALAILLLGGLFGVIGG